MPGRQAHGRPLLGQSMPKHAKKSRLKSKAQALDAFALAVEQIPQSKKGVRTRDIDPEPTGRKRHRLDGGGVEEDDDNEDDGEEGADVSVLPPKKRAKAAAQQDMMEGTDSDYGSDSEGNEWHIGQAGGDDDSEIDSDEAFGESDEEKFENFTFRGSRSKGTRGADLDEEPEGFVDDESLGDDAIDLAQALDQVSDDEDGSRGDTESESEDDDDDDGAEAISGSDEDEDDTDPSKLNALQDLVSGFADLDEQDAEAADSTVQKKPKIELKDLGLYGVKDPDIKKSLKLMRKEETATKPGSSRKLDVPLAKRQQDRLLRSAAFEKASETLDRWTETVKHNRRAEHLFFPLPQSQPGFGLDNSELLPLTKKVAVSELEQTIMSIMEESGLGPTPKQESKLETDDQTATVSRSELKELWNHRRRERELFSREQARAKRIKKIKSKAYHRVHRKERIRDEIAAKEAMALEGGLDSEEEREAQDRRRALERMGARHKESKWAKMAAKTGRAAWDDDFREGLKDMARKDEELRRRVEGRAPQTDEDEDGNGDSDASDESEKGEKVRLLGELNLAAASGGGAQGESRLLGMAFMRRAEESLKKANDDLIKQIRRDLDSDNNSGSEEQEEVEIGRRQYGVSKPKTASSPESTTMSGVESTNGARTGPATGKRPERTKSSLSAPQVTRESQNSSTDGAGAWSRAAQERSKGSKKARSGKDIDIDLSSNVLLATKPPKPPKPKQAESNGDNHSKNVSEDEEGDDTVHLPLAIRDQELIKRAFAGEDVVGDFAREKAAIAAEDDDKEVDNTLPGWGSWVGEGVSARERARHSGRFVARAEGAKRKDLRRDARLERVIVSERRARKTDRYRASQLPHPFESKEQYERALRMPVGQQWMTKETFQEATKPRVIVKQGIIAPMTRPMV